MASDVYLQMKEQGASSVIVYHFRNESVGVSIQRVMGLISQVCESKYVVRREYAASAYSSLMGVMQNVIGTYVRAFGRNPVGHHVTGDVHYLLLALPSSRTIVTVHDIGFYTNHPKGPKSFFKWLLWIYVLKLARKVVFISDFTKQQVLEHVSLRSNQIEVIQNPISSGYQPHAKMFEILCPRILHVGTGLNKNLARTVNALNGLNCHLRIVGRLSDEMKQLLDSSGLQWSNVFGISDEAMHEEYRQCDIVNFPSLFEGFGMPVIEGQAVGRVVITSDREPMRGIAGDGAILVDPESVESIRQAYLDVLASGELRERLVRAGLENVKRYSAEAVFAQYDRLYQEILAEGKS